MESQVTFYCDGVRIVGYLHQPDTQPPGRRLPGIVLCHGFNGAQSVALPEIARHYAAAGFVTLRFDYRGIGESEGVRGRIVPAEYIKDIRAALTFMQTQPTVEPEQLGLHGTSFGGGHAVATAAIDQRVKVVVSVVGVGNGRRWLQSLRRAWEWAAFLRRVEEHRRQRVLTGESLAVSPYELMVPDPPTQAMHAERARLAGRPAPDVLLESAEAILEYAPENLVDQIAPRPVLFVHSAADELVLPDESRAMFERAGEPKRLVLLPGRAHYDVYAGACFVETMSETTAWFKAYL